MARPRRVPEFGDVETAVVAAAMRMTIAEFEAKLPELRGRGFPPPDPTTGRWCIEAVHRWRQLRTPELFPELTQLPSKLQARKIIDARRRQLFGAN